VTEDRNKNSVFIIGGRYANRRGKYEVLDLKEHTMLIRYDDMTEQEVSIVTQARILTNMAVETASIAPYSASLSKRNDQFFFTLGFLAIRVTMIEAIVPPHALVGFSQNYSSLKGAKPRQGQGGLYVHRFEVDKWGCELRITFRATQQELTNLDFGPDAHVVEDPANPGTRWRINNNGFWWRLLNRGFEMGNVQSANQIRTKIPLQYKQQFDLGGNAASSI